MKKLKLGNWISVNDRLPGRDEKVLAVDPDSGEQTLVTGAELATDMTLEYWAPLASKESVREFFKNLREPGDG